MTVQFVGNFTEAMKTYTEEKIAKIQTKGIECENVRVKLDFLPRDMMVLEVSINNKIRNSKKGDDFYALIVDAVDSICSQVNRYKKYSNRKNAKEVVYEETNMFTEVARTKLLYLEKMSQDDAIEAMEVLDHSFFIYKDIDRSDDVCVVYNMRIII